MRVEGLGLGCFPFALLLAVLHIDNNGGTIILKDCSYEGGTSPHRLLALQAYCYLMQAGLQGPSSKPRWLQELRV